MPNSCQDEIKQMKYDLAIVHEHTNLSTANTKEIFYEALQMIRRRTKKYANLRMTAGPLYTEGHDLICDMSDFFVKKSSVVYEVGCSTGTLGWWTSRYGRSTIRRTRFRHDGRGR